MKNSAMTNEILEKMEILEKNQKIGIKNSLKNITNKPNKVEERISGIEDKVDKVLHSHSKKKKCNHNQNIPDLSDTINRQNLQIVVWKREPAYRLKA
jgi:hypothetical protein